MTEYTVDLNESPGDAELTLSEWVGLAIELDFLEPFTIEIKNNIVSIRQGDNK